MSIASGYNDLSQDDEHEQMVDLMIYRSYEANMQYDANNAGIDVKLLFNGR